MKKIYPMYERLICVLMVLLLNLIAIALFIKYNSNGDIVLVIIGFTCITFVAAALLKLFFIPSFITIKDDRVEVADLPFWATNRFYKKKRGLILYNSIIRLNDIEKIELVTLTREEQSNFVGYKHWFRKYLKFNLHYGTPKYVSVGNYSNYQINKILKIISNHQHTK